MQKTSRLVRSAAAMAAAVLLSSTPALAQRGTVSGTVTDAAGNPIGGATVLVVETSRSATTAADGGYSMQVAAGPKMVLAAAAGFAAQTKSVTVEADGSHTVDFALTRSLAQFGDELVVLGSRAARTAIETPVPVDVLSTDDIVDTGMTETSRMIQFLAPSFNFSTSTISDGTDIVRPSTLRGLGPDQTLVLLNGKRRHNSALVHVNGSIGRGTAGVDLNAIPASAIERVEILRDGAAAQYGSDAIAGVLNVVLKSSVGKTQVDLNVGQQYEGDGEVTSVSLNRGWEVGNGGFLNLTAEYRDRGFTNRAGPDPRRIFNFLEQQFGQPALSSGTPDPREQTYNRLNHRYGDAESENLYLFVNSDIPVGEDASFYFFGGISEREGESAGFNRLPSQSRTSILIHPEGHLPLINTSVDDLSFAAGVRKSFGDWSMDASVTHGDNEFNFFISNSANTSLGAASPTSADAGTLKFGQTSFNLDFFGARTLGSTPVNVAIGAEWREDRYEIVAGDTASWVDGGVPDQFGGRAPAGIQVFPGFRPSNQVDESRDNVALYGDVEINPSERLLIGLAARYEDYSDFGETLDGKLALRYEVSDRFAWRGSVQTGFRAPSLHQANFNNISTQFVDVGGVITPLEVGTFRVSSAVARALGAQPLKEETSTGYSLGFTARPRPDLSITVDVFKVDIDDRIVISGRFAASNPQIAPLLAPFGVSAAQFFTNAIDTETEGADVVVAWSKPLGDDGSLSITGAVSLNETSIAGPVRTPPQLAGLGETLFDTIERTYVETGQPRESGNLAARYRRGPFGLLVRVNHFGDVTTTESSTDPTALQTFGAKQLVDVDVSYRLGNGVTLRVGANNVFDVYPDKQIARNDFNGIFVYPRRSAPFGFNGGYYYARLTFEF